MILHLAAGTPLPLRLAADAALIFHIGGGTIGLGSGITALVAKKGGRLHRWAGYAFVTSMLTMATIGCVVAAMFPDRLSSAVGALTFYLVLTGWRTLRRPRPTPDRWDIAVSAIAAGVVIADLSLGALALGSPKGEIDGDPAAVCFVFAAIAALALSLDLRMLVSRGVIGAARTARHIWRMNIALLIASTSLFQGQDQLFPKPLRGSLALAAPDLFILGMMIFWLVRTYWRRWPRRGLAARAA